MFHWICPECGREIPPTVKECPACDPAAAPLPAPVAAPVATPPEPVAAAPQPVEPPRVETPAALAAPVQVPPIEIPAPVAPPPLPVAAAPKPEVPVAIKAEPEPEPLLDPMLVLAEQIRAAQVATLEPAPTPDQGLNKLPAAAAPEPAPVPAVEPAPVAAPAAQPVALLAPPEPQPEQLSLAVEPVPVQEGKIDAPAPVVEALAPVLPEAVAPPKIEPPVLAPAPEVKADAKPEDTPTPVVKNLTEAPPPADKPPSGSWLQLAPLQNYSSTVARTMQPAAPPVQILTPDAGPKMTLPGPALPPKLERLSEASVVTVIGEPPARARRGGMPGWLISLTLMLGIPIAGAGLLFYFSPLSRSSAEAKQPPAEAVQSAAPEPASHPVSQLVEVTGFRIVVDFNKKSEIHYLVVNHSAADLSDVTVFVTLKNTNAKPGQPPLTRFSFRAPSLGPFESKEMTSPIEKLSRSVALPEWQDLRADVQIGQ